MNTVNGSALKMLLVLTEMQIERARRVSTHVGRSVAVLRKSSSGVVVVVVQLSVRTAQKSAIGSADLLNASWMGEGSREARKSDINWPKRFWRLLTFQTT